MSMLLIMVFFTSGSVNLFRGGFHSTASLCCVSDSVERFFGGSAVAAQSVCESLGEMFPS